MTECSLLTRVEKSEDIGHWNVTIEFNRYHPYKDVPFNPLTSRTERGGVSGTIRKWSHGDRIGGGTGFVESVILTELLFRTRFNRKVRQP